MISRTLKALCLLSFFAIAEITAFAQQHKTWKDIPTNLIPYRKRAKWGFSDRDKRLVIPAVYDLVYPFGLTPYENRSVVISTPDQAYARKGDSCFVLKADKSRKFVILLSKSVRPEKPNDEEDDDADVMVGFGPGGYKPDPPVTVNGMKYNFVNLIDKLRDGTYYRAEQTSDGKQGILRDSIPVIPFEYKYLDVLGRDEDRTIIATKEKSATLLTIRGAALCDCRYDKIGTMGYEAPTFRLLTSEKRGLRGLIDWKGKVIAPCKYERLYGFKAEDGLCRVKLKGGKRGYINCEGTEYFEE